jgi:hypothetical protein
MQITIIGAGNIARGTASSGFRARLLAWNCWAPASPAVITAADLAGASPGGRNRITIAGELGRSCPRGVPDFDIERDGPDPVLAGDLDQAALSGALSRILSLGLELARVHRADDGAS